MRVASRRPDGASAALVLSDGTIFWGAGIGARRTVVGEVCFNTSITGYQEIMTDPSYAGQIIVFATVHVGNYGVATAHMESDRVHARAVIMREGVVREGQLREPRGRPGPVQMLRGPGHVRIGGRPGRRRLG